MAVVTDVLERLGWRARASLTVLAGAATVLAFAPFSLWPVQIAGTALLFALLVRQPLRRSAALAWLFSSTGLFGGVCWLLIAMTRYGGMPWLLALLALALLVAALGAYAALAAAAARFLGRRWRVSEAVALVGLWPVCWAVAEWLRGWVLTGFPWIASGYAHVDSPLAGFAPVLGVYGLAYLNALCAGLVAAGALDRGGWRRKAGWLMALALLLAAGQGLRGVQWTQPDGQPLSVSLLQGNVAQDMKFDPEHVYESLVLYRDMMLAERSDLVVTPETALPLLSSQLPPDYLPALREHAQTTGTALVLGLGMHDGGRRYSNSVLGLSRAPAVYRYDKHHLVPFGEFVPAGFQWLVDMMQIPLGDFSSKGLLQAPLAVADQRVLPNICYEDLFGEEIAAQLSWQAATEGRAASILLNVSNLAWYGDSIAIPQHLQISRMRALETGRPVLRATNTGATAAIAANGTVLDQLPANARAVLRVRVQGSQGLTPYVKMGNKSILLIWIIVFLFIWRRAKPYKTSSFG